MKISPAVILYAVGLARALVLHHCSDKNEVTQAFYKEEDIILLNLCFLSHLGYTPGVDWRTDFPGSQRAQHR